MRLQFAITVSLLSLAAAGALSSSIDLSHESTVTLNDVHGSIDTVTYVDLFGTNDPEIVLLDDSGVQVYSSLSNTLLAERPLTGAIRRLAVLDMNGDDLRDIVVLRVLSEFDLRYIDLILLDNASGFVEIDTLSFVNNTVGYLYSLQPPMLAVLDTDNDGSQELVFSYDVLELTLWNLGDRLVGSMIVFDDFQSPQDVNLHRSIRNAVQITSPDGSKAVLIDKRSMDSGDMMVLEYMYVDSYIDQWYGVDSSQTLHTDNHPDNGMCFTPDEDPGYHRASRRMRTWGQLTGDNATVEIVSTLQHYQFCEHYDGELDTTYYSAPRYLSLHRFTSGQPLQEFWTKEITGEDWRAFVYLPQFPGYFFAVVDGSFSQFRGGDGSLFQSSPDVPEGDLYWARPFADSLDRLIALDGNTVSIYVPDIVTGTGDDVPDALPGSFRLSEPYPNPFNPSVSFSIRLPVRSEMTVRVYNALGQEVEQIYRGTLPAGERTFVWDAGGHPSGVYFIRATTEAGTLTKKAVLVK